MKRRRPNPFDGVRIAGVTTSSLHRVLAAVRARPAILQEAAATNSGLSKQLQGAIEHSLRDAAATLDLPLDSGGVFSWYMLKPHLIVRVAVKTNTTCRHIVHAAARRCPLAAPWNLILYHDEITPGNVLRPDNKNKIMAIYFSFIEFKEMLRCEDAWLPIGVLRHSLLSKIKGGVSGVTKMLVRDMFLPSVSSLNFTTGAALEVEGSMVLLFAKLACVLADESALKSTWAVKGASGLRPCMLCKNAVSKTSDVAHRDVSQYLVDITEPCFSSFDPATDTDIWELYDLIDSQSLVLNKGALADFETAVGMNHCTHGILADTELRPHVKPSTTSAYDSMHCLLSHGTASLEIYLFVSACKKQIGMKYEDLQQYCSADWRMPAHGNCAAKAGSIFAPGRDNKDGFKGMASDVLAIYPLLRQLAQQVVKPTGKLSREVDSFLAMCECIDRLQQLKRSKADATADQCNELQEALCRHFKLFLSCYGAEEIRPKHHYSLHLPSQILKHKMLLDTFVLERKHRLYKTHATEIDRLTHFERAVLQASIAEQLYKEENAFATNLQGPTTQRPEFAAATGVAAATVANRMRIGLVTITVDDMLTCDYRCAMEVKACVQVDGDLNLMVHCFEFVRTEGFAKVWRRVSAELVMFDPAEGFLQQDYWSFDADGLLLSLGCDAYVRM